MIHSFGHCGWTLREVVDVGRKTRRLTLPDRNLEFGWRAKENERLIPGAESSCDSERGDHACS